MTPFRIAAAALLLAASIRPAHAEDAKAKAPPQMSAAEQAMM